MGAGKPHSLREVGLRRHQAVELLQSIVYASHDLSKLRGGDFARGHMAVPVRVHVSRSFAEDLPGVRIAAAHGAMLRLRRDGEIAGAMKVRLTERCLDLLRSLQAARWLTTGQVWRRFFPDAKVNAVHKYMRRLARAGYVVMLRENRMAEALFTLGPEGKRVLEQHGGEDILLMRKRPKQLEHLIGINDFRLAAELSGKLTYFFACWELAQVGWRHPIIPDAVFSMGARTFALEFDRGLEGVRYLKQTKVSAYLRGLEGFPLAAVIIVADRKTRMEFLARAIGDVHARILYTTIDLVRQRGISAPVFYQHRHSEGLTLV